MTNHEQDAGIGSRVRRLAALRADLTLARSVREAAVRAIYAAKDSIEYEHLNRTLPQEGSWMSSTELSVLLMRVRELERETSTIISELLGLGMDPHLFKLNGDD